MQRGRVLIIMGIVLGLITGVMIFIMSLGAGGGEKEAIPTVQVVIAQQPIYRHEEIESKIGMKPMPTDYVPLGVYTDVVNLEGKGFRAVSDIPQGLPIQESMISRLVSEEEVKEPKEEPTPLTTNAFLIPEGLIAMGFPIQKSFNATGYMIKPGDFVDIIFSIELTPPTLDDTRTRVEPVLVTQYALQDVLVLRMGVWNAPLEQATEKDIPVITLALKPEDALILKYLKDDDAVEAVDFILRAPGDHEIRNLEQVSLEYLKIRYNLEIPPQQ